jgi:hypothetical protein
MTKLPIAALLMISATPPGLTPNQITNTAKMIKAILVLNENGDLAGLPAGCLNISTMIFK